MTDDEQVSLLHQLIREHFPHAPQTLAPELRFGPDLRGDSLSVIELVTAIETELHVRLPDAAAAAARTVGDLTALVRATARTRASGPAAPQ